MMLAFFVYNLNGHSGAAKQALLLGKSLEVPLLIFNHEYEEKFSVRKINDRVELVNLPENKFLSLVVLVYFTLKKNIKIFHLHGFFKHGLILGRILRRKVVLKTTLMGGDDLGSIFNGFRLKFFAKFLFSCIDVNVCLTRQLEEKNREYISEPNIIIIPNSVRVPENIYYDKNNVFCFVGVVCERKGAYESIEYFLNQYSELPGAVMYIVGAMEGPKECDPCYVERCHEMVRNYCAEDKVIFTGGQNASEVSRYFSISKALIFFSKNEGLPNVVLESMSFNCAPVTLGLDGVVEDILGSEGKELVLKKTGDSLPIEVIDRIIEEGFLVKRASSAFSISSVRDHYLSLYEGLVF